MLSEQKKKPCGGNAWMGKTMQDDFITFLYFCALDDAAAAASVYERVIKLQKTGRNCVVSRIVFQSFHDSLLDEVEKISAQHDLDLGLLLHCAFHLEPFFKKKWENLI